MVAVSERLKKMPIYQRVSQAILDLLSPSYKEMLDTYPNLQQLTAALKNMSFGGVNGYDTALSILGGSYDPAGDWATLQALFEQLQTPSTELKIFLARAIHILWMEKHGRLPWTIKDYSTDEINALFYEVNENNYRDPSIKPNLSVPVPSQNIEFEEYGDPNLELETSYKLHELALKMKADTKELTVTNAMRWIKTEFFHAYNSWSFDKYSDDPFPANLGELFGERIVGCHETVLLLSGILRSLNIPTVNILVGEHGVTCIPSLDSYVHGDHLANRPLVPVTLMLLTKDEILQYTPEDDMFENLLETKVSTLFDNVGPLYLFTTTIRRTGSSLTLNIAYNGPAQVQTNIVQAFQTEAQQYNIQYDAATKTFTSQAVPIQSLVSLST